ncbi:cytochrome-b5 reductase [Galdieria sulphuraria]|uniref:Cytochrome-b5 reductase n=1 Tax=Galdieria sulphuraria TaxID=130081 RepID=M2X818_GALSU|nr:cytochrome-b5 reductase [Galdieria sulphuraria]EME25982.1 cytochrome-b5 reductase [Galdieria sulphuraria]|eukprot:XP_005702502.1 cytochrome-b5 reductase [Galdieria sulphuraria]
MEECPVDSAHEERMTELGERISDLIATPKPYMDSIKQLVSLGSSSNTIVFSLLLGILLGAASYIGFQRRKRTNEPLDPPDPLPLPIGPLFPLIPTLPHDNFQTKVALPSFTRNRQFHSPIHTLSSHDKLPNAILCFFSSFIIFLRHFT